MFRHRKERTLIHNLKLASLLSFVAGIVNICGLMSVQLLTTNITGHFAFFSEGIVLQTFKNTFIYGLLVLAFFLGAFVSSFLMESRAKREKALIGAAPVIFEIVILIIVGILPSGMSSSYPTTIACLLSFAMGMQNALVTSISRSIVRTTHLTGLFTDLGIELAQLIFYQQEEQQKRLFSSIKLHLSIILSFFMGIIIGGLAYSEYTNKTFLLAAVLLVFGMAGRNLFISMMKLKRQLKMR